MSHNTDLLFQRSSMDSIKLNMEDPIHLNYNENVKQGMLQNQDFSNLNTIPNNWGVAPPYPTQTNQNLPKPLKPYQPKVTVWNLNKMLRKMGIFIPNHYCSKMWCVRDFGGYIAASFTWALIMVGEFMIIMNCMANNVNIFSYLNIIISIIAALLGFFSHCQAMFSDPGVVPRGNATAENISKMTIEEGQVVLKCVKCDSIKPDRAHHCSVCRRCIRKMDHHCPWINNCVGELNQKYFVLFTGYICFISTQGFCLALHTLLTCVSDNFKGCNFSELVTLLITIGLMLEGLLFGLFTAIMCSTQLNSICSDQTGIESLKKERRKRKSGMEALREVFGGKFSYKWFSPFHPSLDPHDNRHYHYGPDSTCINF